MRPGLHSTVYVTTRYCIAPMSTVTKAVNDGRPFRLGRSSGVTIEFSAPGGRSSEVRPIHIGVRTHGA